VQKRLLALVALLAATVVYAGSYTISTTTAQDGRLERHRLRTNKATCASAALPADCTQAQARKVILGVNIYADVADMIDRLILKGFLDGLKAQDTSDDAQQFCTWFRAATVAQQNSACALAGLPNGCEICP